jgi:hypothetical protein
MSHDIAVNDRVTCDWMPKARGVVVDIITLPEVGRRALVDWRVYQNQFQTEQFSRFHPLESLRKNDPRRR